MSTPHFLRVVQNLALLGLAAAPLGACCGAACELPPVENAPPPPAASEATLPTDDTLPPVVVTDACPANPPMPGSSGYTPEAAACATAGARCSYESATECYCVSSQWQCHREHPHPKGPLPPPDLPSA